MANINLRPGVFSGLIAHLAGWVRGRIIRGGVFAWEVYNASPAGQILVGDGIDVNSVVVDGDATLVADGTMTVSSALTWMGW